MRPSTIAATETRPSTRTTAVMTVLVNLATPHDRGSRIGGTSTARILASEHKMHERGTLRRAPGFLPEAARAPRASFLVHSGRTGQGDPDRGDSAPIATDSV